MFKQVFLVVAATVLVFNEQIQCRNLFFSPRGEQIVRETTQLANRIARQAAEPQPAPQPYSFDINSQDENGTIITRSESGDGTGKVQGQYMYQDPISGLYRVVSYIADENGFNVKVETNEPGTKTSNPANAEYISSASRR